jgi:trigger factor
MKTVVEQVGPCRKVVKVEVPAEVVSAEYNKVVSEFSKHARVAGFRAGKAPAAIVERQFTKNILEETRERLVPRAYHEALQQEKLKPVSVVDVSEIQLDKQLPLSFKVTVDVVPEFKVPACQGIPVTSKTVDVKDEDVEKVITNMRDRQSRFEAVTGRAAGKGDVVEIDYTATCDGKSMKEVAPANAELAEGKDFWVLVGDDMPLFLPGMPGKLEGIESGEQREIEIAFPDDYRVKEVAGKKAMYSVTARGLRERSLPEVNDEFAKTLGTESVDDLKQKIRENLMEAGKMTERDRQRDEVVKWLLENTDLKDLPQSLVEEEARHIIQDVVQENVRRGISKDEIESNRDDIFNRAAQSSTERVKLNYILGRIADEKTISVSDEEVETRIAEMAMRYKMPPQKMKAELEKRDALRSIQGNLRMEKTLDALMAEANVTVA